MENIYSFVGNIVRLFPAGKCECKQIYINDIID